METFISVITRFSVFLSLSFSFRFRGPKNRAASHHPRVMAQNIIVPGIVQRTDDIILTPEQTELLNSSSPLLFLSGPPRTGKTTVLIHQGKKWLECGHDVHIVSTWPKSRAVAIAIEHQIQEFMSPANSSGRVYQHHFNFKEDGEVETAVRSLESKDRERQLCVIADEAADYRFVC